MRASTHLFFGALALLLIVGLLSAAHHVRKRLDHGRERDPRAPLLDDHLDAGGN